ncbi:MAG: metal ABC transporter permease [Coprobacillaceae bacterium]
MINNIIEMFSYTFIIRAIVVGILISLCAALLGVSLVLKKYSMIGDGLSHVAFGSLAIATVCQLSPLYFSLPVVIVVAFLLLRLNENSKIRGDSAIAVISASSMAIGVVVISLSSGTNIDINNYLFGSILAVQTSDVIMSIILALIVVLLFGIFYHEIFAVTFDETFAKAIGVKTNLYISLIAVLTAITIVIGMRLMGSLLISSLIIFPALTAMMLFKTFFSVTVCSVIISVVTFLIGITISYSFSTPIGATIVCINLILLIIFYIISAIRKYL